jgi:hypothetical protein
MTERPRGKKNNNVREGTKEEKEQGGGRGEGCGASTVGEEGETFGLSGANVAGFSLFECLHLVEMRDGARKRIIGLIYLDSITPEGLRGKKNNNVREGTKEEKEQGGGRGEGCGRGEKRGKHLA